MEKSYKFNGKSYSYEELKKLFDDHSKKSKNSINVRLDETLKLIEGKRILDFGCAEGATTKYLAQLNPDRELVGIDYMEDAIKIANDFCKLPNVTYEVRDIFSKPFPDSSFDCIIFTEVIEHVENPFTYLKEFFRILSPGGFLILSTPNATSLKNIFYALSYRKKSKRNIIINEISNEPSKTGTHLEHIFNWDFPTLVRLIMKSGFTIYEHTFARSGPIMVPFFGKKIQLIKGESQFLKFIPTSMVHHIIKAQKPVK